MLNSGLLSSNSFEWYTPLSLFSVLNSEFHFDLDPCAEITNRLGVKNFFTIHDDGLSKNWCLYNSIFINPPYGRSIYKWIEKAYNTFIDSNHSITIVLLLPVRTDTKWFHNFLYNDFCSIRFLKGRVKFCPNGNSAPFPSMICIFKKIVV